MRLPGKFRPLVELEDKDVVKPDYIWLEYSVCVLSNEACGWSGWIIGGAFKSGTKDTDAPTHQSGDQVLPADDNQICPRCGRTLFRTGVDVRMEPSVEQIPVWEEGVNIELVPIEFTDEV